MVDARSRRGSSPRTRPGPLHGIPTGPLLLLPLALGALTLLPDTAHGQGYGYGGADDPLVTHVKAALSAAKEGNDRRVGTALEPLEIFIEEVRKGLEVDIEKTISEARKSKQHRVFGFALCELVYHQIRLKLENNLAEELRDPAKCRARVEAARLYYEQILSLVVKLADAKHGTNHHPTMLADFDALRATVGSEGLFGVGAQPANPEEYRIRASAIVDRLESIFPQWAHPRPTDLGGAPDPGPEKPSPPADPKDSGKPRGGGR